MDPKTVADVVSAGSDNPVAIIGVLIPIVAIVMGLGIGMLKIWLDFRKKRDILQAHHAERMAAIEKGIELPSLPPGFYSNESSQVTPEMLQQEFKGRASGLHYLRSGLMWLLIGIAISVALYADHDVGEHGAAWWGGVPAAFGLSKLLFYFIANRKIAGDKAPSDSSTAKE
jgi:hypothetical protein